MIERDDNIGSLDDLITELEHAKALVKPFWDIRS